MKKVGIVILNYNGIKDTVECLRSLEKSSYRDFFIVIVDNGSKDNSVELIKKEFNKVLIIENDINLGFSEGNNVGISGAIKNGADYILLINNDTIVDPNLIKELLKTAESEAKIGIVSPKIYFEKEYEFHKNRYKKEELGKVLWYAGGIMDWKNVIGHHRGVDEVDKGQYDQVEETDFASGCCMLIKKKVFEDIGFLDKKYFLYYEDNDLCQRAKICGYKLIYCPNGLLWHKNAGSAGGSGSEMQDYYITRNRLLFAMRYSSIKSKLALIRESFWLLFSGRKWQKKGILDFYLRKFKKGSFSL